MVNRKMVIVIFLISLIVRVAFVTRFPQFSPDTDIYDAIALNLVRGLGYTVDGSTPHIIRPPLYPFFLASVYSTLGHSFMAVRLLQAFISSITVVFVYKLARTVSGNDRVALVSALIACFYPELIARSAYILSETLTIFLLTSSVWLLTESIKRHKIGLGLVAGFLLGLVTLSLPLTLAFAGFSLVGFLLIYGRSKRWLPLWAVFSLAMMLAIAPWTIRNYIAFNTFIPVTMGTGSKLRIESCGLWSADYNVLHYSILILFAIGLFSVYLRNKERWIPVMAILYFTLLHTTFFSISRYWILIAPLVLTFAGAGLLQFFESIRFSLTKR